MDQSEMMFGCIYYTLSCFLLPTVASTIHDLWSIPLWICQFGLFLCNFLFTIFIFHSFLLREGKKVLSCFGPFLGYSALGLVFYFATNWLVEYLIYFVRPDFINLNDMRITSFAQDGGILVAIGTVALVPVAEELLYRGLLFEAVREKHPAWGWILSIVAFSAAHVLGYLGSYDCVSFALACIQYLPAGLCLAWAYRASGTIFSPILMHTVINFVGITTLL